MKLELKNQYIILCTLLILTLAGCHRDNPNIEYTKDYQVAVIMSYENEEEYEVRKYNNEQELKIYKNGEYQSSTGKNYDVKEIMSIDIPESVSKSDKINLSDLGVIADNTYEIEIEDSGKYVRQLLDDGYNMVYRVDTYKFIEMYLGDSDGVHIRLIITPEYMVVYETTGIETININDYIFE